MRFEKAKSLEEIVSIIQPNEIIGSEYDMVYGINEIHKLESGDISFVDNPKYYKRSFNTAAHFLIIDQKPDDSTDKVLLICDNPFEAYDRLMRYYRPLEPLQQKKGHNTRIHESVILEPNVVIGNHVTVGKGCYIQANVYIGDYTVIGDHVNIQAGAILGTDAFYFKKDGQNYQKWRSGGRVVIHDHVEIGAACTINKGVSGDTVIGRGTKLDSQVHLGHGVVIGEDCLLAAQVGIGGKTIVGDRVIMYGQVGVAQNLKIEDDTVILAKSGISKNLKGKNTYFGYPAAEVKVKYKELATLRILSRK